MKQKPKDYQFGGYWMLHEEMERLEQYAGLAKGFVGRPLEGINNVEASSSTNPKSPKRLPVFTSTSGGSTTKIRRDVNTTQSNEPTKRARLPFF